MLPTGAGKTETMLAVQVYRQLFRTLVLVPSEVLRSQIGRKFLTLGVLPDVGVVPVDIARPRVALLRKGEPHNVSGLNGYGPVIIKP